MHFVIYCYINDKPEYVLVKVIVVENLIVEKYLGNMYIMNSKEVREYQYLHYKFIFDKNLDEKEKERYNELQEKYIAECERKFRFRKYLEEEEYRKEIFQKIKPECKFKSKFVKGGISGQTDEYDAFYDIEIYSYPLMKIYDNKINNQICKYHKIRGISKYLSTYACYKQSLWEYHYLIFFFLPAINEAYEDYVRENFYGKKGYENGMSCKKFQIDWFDEVFVTDEEKILTSFQIWYKDLYDKKHKQWTEIHEWKHEEPESWERAWIDSVEYDTKQEWYYFCEDLKRNPEDYPDISNPIEYLKEANKITGKKFI